MRQTYIEDFLRTIHCTEYDIADIWDNGTDEFHYYDAVLYGETVTIKFVINMRIDTNMEVYKRAANEQIWELI